MKIRRAEKNYVGGVRTFYVESENPKTPDVEYIVVELKRDGRTTYFCNCGDFFGRRLPFLGTNQFANCKHGAAVKEAVKGNE